jgi:hypothetical protein
MDLSFYVLSKFNLVLISSSPHGNGLPSLSSMIVPHVALPCSNSMNTLLYVQNNLTDDLGASDGLAAQTIAIINDTAHSNA